MISTMRSAVDFFLGFFLCGVCFSPSGVPEDQMFCLDFEVS